MGSPDRRAALQLVLRVRAGTSGRVYSRDSALARAIGSRVVYQTRGTSPTIARAPAPRNTANAVTSSRSSSTSARGCNITTDAR
jgi:hypothetical protein